VSVLFTDAITRADAATLGADYLQLKGMTGRLGVFSNQVDVGTINADVGDAIDAGISWPNDQYMQAKIVFVAPNGNNMLWVRGEAVVGSALNGYLCGQDIGFWGDNSILLNKWVAGVRTNLANTAVQLSNGAILRVEIRASAPATLKAFLNGAEQLSTTDSSIAAGKPGLAAWHQTANEALFDDLEAGDLTTPPVRGLGPLPVSLQQRMAA
jgi:hypothetical protein